MFGKKKTKEQGWPYDSTRFEAGATLGPEGDALKDLLEDVERRIEVEKVVRPYVNKLRDEISETAEKVNDLLICNECGGAFSAEYMQPVLVNEEEQYFCRTHRKPYEKADFILGVWYYSATLPVDEEGTPDGFVPIDEVEEMIAIFAQQRAEEIIATATTNAKKRRRSS